MDTSFTIAVTFIAYIALMYTVGYWSYRQTHSLSDYILGGRRLGPWVTALSAGASDMSGWLLLGLPGYVYAAGLEAFWLVIGLALGTYLNWRWVALRLRIYSEMLEDALTLPEFFERRFNDSKHLLRMISATFILIFFMFYTSSGLVAGGKLFESVFGLPYVWAVSLGALAVIGYTLFGGFLAVAWTDLFQGLLMAAALITVPVFAMAMQGGVAVNLQKIEAVNTQLLNPLTTVGGDPLTFITMLSLLAWGLGYFGQPHILTRFKAIRDVYRIPVARRIAMVWTVVSLAGALFVGFAGIAEYGTSVAEVNHEKIFILLVSSIFHPLVAGVLLAAILAAIMSTADSQLLASSSVLAEDFYKSIIRTSASAHELIVIGRTAVVLISAIAYVLALDPNRKVLDLVSYAWAGFGAAFGPVLLLSLFWKNTTKSGAICGILLGGLTVIVWKQMQGGIFDLYELVPGFIISLLVIVLTSLLSKPVDEVVARRHQAYVDRLRLSYKS